jgi:hypothetical protein
VEAPQLEEPAPTPNLAQVLDVSQRLVFALRGTGGIGSLPGSNAAERRSPIEELRSQVTTYDEKKAHGSCSSGSEFAAELTFPRCDRFSATGSNHNAPAA